MKFWIVKGNPEINDLADMLHPGKNANWYDPSDQRKNGAKAGDGIFFWSSGRDRFLIGLGQMKRPFTRMDDDYYRFDLTYLTKPLPNKVSLVELKREPLFDPSNPNRPYFMIPGPVQTRYPLTDGQAKRLAEMILEKNPRVEGLSDILTGWFPDLVLEDPQDDDAYTHSNPEVRAKTTIDNAAVEVLGRRVFVYRWGTNPDLWGNSPSPKRALQDLLNHARSGRTPKLGWEIGPDNGRTPQYAKSLRAGDVLLFYAGAEFKADKGVYGVALAGTSTDEKAGALAIPKGERHLKFRWLTGKAMADLPFKGHDDVFAPPGPASTLIRLKRLPPDVRQIVENALRRTALELQFPTEPPLDNIVAQIEELPETERIRVKREIERVVRDAKLRSRVCKHWGYACAACELELSDEAGNYECEVAHIRAVGDGGKDLLSNSLPLCRSHHWAFDRHLWCIEPNSLVIKVQKKLHPHPWFKELHGRKLRLPTSSSGTVLAKENLQHRWDQFMSIRNPVSRLKNETLRKQLGRSTRSELR